MAALIAAGASVALGIATVFLIILGIWLFAAHGSETTTEVVKAACTAWLGIHLVPVTISNTTLSLLPWGFIVVPMFIVRRATHWAFKSAQPTQAREYLQVTVLFSVFYGVIASAVSYFSSGKSFSTNMLMALLHGGVIACLIAITSVLHYAPSRTVLFDSLPESVATGLRIGAGMFGLYLCLGAAINCVLLALHWSEIKSVLDLMTTGAVDGFFLILLALGYLPTASVWTMSYLLGVNIHLGGISAVSLTAANPGALPAFPLFSLLPSGVPSWGQYAIALPIVAGLVLYRSLPKSYWQPEGENAQDYFSQVVRRFELGALLWAVTTLGLLAAAFTYISSGALGNHLLKSIGPVPLDVTIAVTAVTGLTAFGLLVIPRVFIILLRLWSERKRDTEA